MVELVEFDAASRFKKASASVREVNDLTAIGEQMRLQRCSFKQDSQVAPLKPLTWARQSGQV